ncbi:hypothetical protein DDF62_14640 [Caulobacter radicis]|uniref:hypothetical protein n=1 Tax=Caulobacter radicis TaxID=2172650 RepID=UPI000D572459|nr:hypothetical protein [Caulobacter radicis]PVM88430.1 hypothetical protein DDF62_14640 [Caulobacter radicis]
MSSPGPIRILLQTTIPTTEDDWSIARFSALRDLLSGAVDGEGRALYAVEARDREATGGPDPVLSRMQDSDFDQLWLFAVDVGDGLTEVDCVAVSRFRESGGGLMIARDHMDLGSSVCTLGGVGAAHCFHSRNLEPDAARHVRDDEETQAISWPNYRSGANGDYQEIVAIAPVHPILRDPTSPTGVLRYLPAHPHEGAVIAPQDGDARVIAAGASRTTGRAFNLAVAFERGPAAGAALAQSTFHHFADYNWDLAAGCPSFVSETPGEGMAHEPRALADTHRYMLNLAAWLGRRGLSA